MLATAKMIGFVSTTDYAAARAFYEEKLGFTFVSQDTFAMVLRGGADMIRVVQTPHKPTVQGTVLGWEVDDIEATVDWLAGRGVITEKYSFVQDRQRGIFVTSHGRVAWFKDPDGNVLSLSQQAGEDVCMLPG